MCSTPFTYAFLHSPCSCSISISPTTPRAFKPPSPHFTSLSSRSPFTPTIEQQHSSPPISLAAHTMPLPNSSFSSAAAAADCSCGDTDDESDDDGGGEGFLDNCETIRDCEDLIEGFMVDDDPTLPHWTRLLVLNNKWNRIKSRFFGYCRDRARDEDDPWTKNKLLWLGEKLKEIDEDVQRHNELIELIEGRRPSEISEIVSSCRKDFTKEFFVHLHTVAESYDDNPNAHNEFVKLRNTCLAAVEAYDAATKSIELLDTAELNLQNIIKTHMDAAGREIENLDEESQCFNPDLVARWLWSCYNVEEVGRVHAIVLKCFRDPITYVDNNLICSYLRLDELALARGVFNGMSRRNTVSWTAIINGYLNYNLDNEALKLFRDSIEHGVPANNKMFVCVMNLCSKRADLDLGEQIHARILKSNWRNLIVDSAVVHFYAKCGEMSSAFRKFDRMAERDVVCWTTMITACSRQGLGHDSLSMLSQMVGDGFLPNEYTVCAALKACGENKALKFGKQLHGAVVKKICKSDVFVGTSLIDMYAKCGETASSKKVFDKMRVRNTATWTSIISGYARNGIGEEAVSLFRLMKRHKVHANKMTIASVVMACGSSKALLIGREVHAQIIKNTIQPNIYIGSTLVWFYCKCKEYSRASKVFEHMPCRDVVSWTAIISGCARLGLESEALEFLQEMMDEGVAPNAYTYSSALKACAKLEAPMQGKLIHSYASKTPVLLSNVFVNSTLIYMYAKCGYVADAFRVFDNMPGKNLVSWKAMILGYARNGHCREALQLMYRMETEGFVVDDYILTTVLTACGDVECGEIERDIKSSSHHLQERLHQ